MGRKNRRIGKGRKSQRNLKFGSVQESDHRRARRQQDGHEQAGLLRKAEGFAHSMTTHAGDREVKETPCTKIFCGIIDPKKQPGRRVKESALHAGHERKAHAQAIRPGGQIARPKHGMAQLNQGEGKGRGVKTQRNAPRP